MRTFPYLVASSGLLALACESGPARAPEGPPSLCEPRVAPAARDGFRVTPRWSPAGDRLVVSGRGGVGLWELDGRTLELRGAIDPAARPPARFSADGRTLRYRAGDGDGELVELTLTTRTRRPVAAGELPPSVALADSDMPVEVLATVPEGKIVFQEYGGRLALVADGREVPLVEYLAWGPAVSPGGRRVAYSVGPVANAALHVVDLDGRDVAIGRGVHPAWLDEDELLFALPTGGPGGEIVASELRAASLPTGVTVPVPTPGAAIPMQPAVSPARDRVAWADWKTGSVHAATLCRGEP